MAAFNPIIMDIDYAFCDTMDEVLLEIIYHCEAVRHTDNSATMNAHLKIASKAMECALRIYGDWLARTGADGETK